MRGRRAGPVGVEHRGLHRHALIRAAAFVALLAAPSLALATAGYFQLGHGLKSKAMAGAGAALPQDALAAAANPAAMVWVGGRLDVALEALYADRGSTITGNTEGLNGDRDANRPAVFPVPELGYNRMLDAQRSFGVALFGNGGTTYYRNNPLGGLSLTTHPGSFEFLQGIAAPTYAVKLNANHSVGVSALLVYQQLQVRGVEHFDDPIFSAYPGSVTNRGWDRSVGVGLRVGWLGRVSPGVSLAAAWQPRTKMTKFRRYKGLLAGQGNFDLPMHYVIGAAWNVTPSLTLAGDVQRIHYADVRSFGNNADCFLAVACLLGTDQGPGSGWRNATVYKLGLVHGAGSPLELRAGFAFLNQPIPSSQTLLNVFSPAVTGKHLAFGATWRLASGTELTVSYQHAFEKRVNGRNSIAPGPIPGGVGGGEADIRMKQRALGVALGWRL